MQKRRRYERPVFPKNARQHRAVDLLQRTRVRTCVRRVDAEADDPQGRRVHDLQNRARVGCISRPERPAPFPLRRPGERRPCRRSGPRPRSSRPGPTGSIAGRGPRSWGVSRPRSCPAACRGGFGTRCRGSWHSLPGDSPPRRVGRTICARPVRWSRLAPFRAKALYPYP